MTSGLKSYAEAHSLLPSNAKWSSSFGYPGDGGYCEYYRTPDGQRYLIQNGQFGDDWSFKKVEA